MRTLFFGVVLAALSAFPLPAQEFFFVEPLPAIEFTLSDLVNILSEYHVIQETNPTFCRQYHGMTDFNERTISVCGTHELTFRRETVIHEALHIKYFQMGINTGGPYEAQIAAKAHEIFLKLYGPTPAPQPATPSAPASTPDVQ